MSPAHHLARSAVLAICLAVGAIPLIPPSGAGNDDARAFSTKHAMELVDRVAQKPRPIGSAENARVRALIIEELRSLGLDPQLQATEVPDYFGGTDATIAVVNVVARINGSDSTGAVTVVGHFDSVPLTPGANDDATAVAIMLDLARVIVADSPLRNDLILLFTDGEEPAPRYGSTAFVDHHPWFDDVGFVINLEAIGTGGPSLLIETNGPNAWIIDQLAAVPYPVAFSFLDATVRLLGGSNTDFAPFRDAGVPGVEFAYLRGPSVYHTERDNAASVGERSLRQHGANTLALVRRLGAVDLGATRDERVSVFFTVAPGVVVRHATGWLLAAMLVSGVAVVWVAWRNRIGLGSAVAATLASLVATAIVTTAAWIPLANWRSTMGIGEGYLYMFATVCLTAAGLDARRRLWKRPVTAVGVVLVWWSLAVATLSLSAGLAYLFAWPAVVATAVVAWPAARQGRLRSSVQFAGFALVSLTAVVLLVPAIDVFFQFAQPRPGNPDSEVLYVIALPAMLTALVVELIAAFWTMDYEKPGGPAAAVIATK